MKYHLDPTSSRVYYRWTSGGSWSQQCATGIDMDYVLKRPEGNRLGKQMSTGQGKLTSMPEE